MQRKSKSSIPVQLAEGIRWSWLGHRCSVVSADLGETSSGFTAFPISSNKGGKRETERDSAKISSKG